MNLYSSHESNLSHQGGNNINPFRHAAWILASVTLALGLLWLGHRIAKAAPDASISVPCAGGNGQVVDLVNAINDANDAPGESRIVIQSVDGQGCLFNFITAASPNQALPMIKKSLIISGGLGRPTLQRGNPAAQMRLFRTSASTVTLTLANLGIRFFSAPANSPNGGAIYSVGDLVLDDVNFYANSADSGNGGAARVRGDATVASSMFISNSSQAIGGAIAVDGEMKAASSEFESNRSNEGGAIYASSVDLDQASFLGNEGTENGGAIFVSGQDATVKRSYFERNQASENGGAIDMAAISATLTLEEVTLLDNQAHDNGGAVYGSRVVLTNSHVISNSARDAGGIAALEMLQAYDSYFVSNTATRLAGGVAANAAHIEDSQFIDNRVGPDDEVMAGGLFLLGGSSILNRVAFTGNIASGQKAYGGASLAVGEDVQISESLFHGNVAGTSPVQSGFGGAIWSLGGLGVQRSIFRDNLATTGGSGLMVHADDSYPTAVTNNLWLAGPESRSMIASHVISAVTSARQSSPRFVASLPGRAGSGIANDDEMIRIYHNTIVGPVEVGLEVPIGHAVARNNIFTEMETGIFATDPGTVVASNNLYYDVAAAEVNVAQGGPGLVVQDPRFVDASGGDYRLQDGSPAIDAGTDVQVYVDKDGSPRPVGTGYDIGAFENPNASDMYSIFLPLVIRQ